jgi:hypothetical protein
LTTWTILKGVPIIYFYQFDESGAELLDWDFPHRDAEIYLESVMNRVQSELIHQQTPDWTEEIDDDSWEINAPSALAIGELALGMRARRLQECRRPLYE